MSHCSGRDRCLRVLWAPPPQQGQAGCAQLPCKDANDVLVQYGASAVQECVAMALPMPVDGPFRSAPPVVRHTVQQAALCCFAVLYLLCCFDVLLGRVASSCFISYAGLHGYDVITADSGPLQHSFLCRCYRAAVGVVDGFPRHVKMAHCGLTPLSTCCSHQPEIIRHARQQQWTGLGLGTHAKCS